MKTYAWLSAVMIWVLAACAPAELAAEPRVVFTGNSICRLWENADPQFFDENSIINAGVSGETSRQILKRFDRDVISLNPGIVLILSPSTNDIAQNEGPFSHEQMVANVAQMIDKVTAAGAVPILASNLPCDHFYWKTDLQPAADIVAVNKLLLEMATDKGVIYIDLHTPMRDGHDALRSEYTTDGCHPTVAGYKAMEAAIMPVVNEVIARVR